MVVAVVGMTDWRLLAERPAFDRSVPLPEDLRPLVLFVKHPQVVDLVILHDPAIPQGQNWLEVFEVTDGEHPRFLSWISDTRIHRLYVPAAAGTGFPSESPLYEGHWRSTENEASELRWPRPDSQWRERAAFRCARWEWPAGFRHYIVEHDVQPSPEFRDFIYAV